MRKHPLNKKSSVASEAEGEFEIPISKILIVLGAVLVIALLVFAGWKILNKPHVESGIAAVVNGKTITWEEINGIYNLIPQDMRTGVSKAALLNQTIRETVVKQEMDSKKIIVSEKELGLFLENTKSQFMCEEQFNTTLAANGWTYETFKEQLLLKLRLNRLIKLEFPELVVNESEMKSFFSENIERLSIPEQIRAEHILVNSSELAETILGMLNKGADFKELALKYSTDKSSLICGGELGFFSKGMMVAEFEEVAFSLKVNETSRPVKTDYGYHIIRVLEKKPAKPADYVELKPLIEMNLLNSKLSADKEKVNGYISGLMEKADIQIK